ncbi:MAG: right-handed parallel beta-helix repeat-containing protein [Bacteroidales bacterium]|nr:right-handed parallel beta-helix repeat-containing protein [Bacteroidales bacterium]
MPHMAIGFLGNDHVIEYNEIDSACYESNDAGAIYTGRNWTMRGNLIQYNYLHDISGFEGKGCVGIYLDDAFSSADIIGNVFRNVTRAMMIGGGRDNNVLNNIFVNCTPSIHVDARGLGWMRNEHIPGWIKEAQDSGTILGIAYNKPPYSVKYPKLSGILDDEPRAPKGECYFT